MTDGLQDYVDWWQMSKFHFTMWIWKWNVCNDF